MIKIFDRFITEMTGLKMTIDTLEEHLPTKITEDIKKYKTALLLDLYLQQQFKKNVDPELSSIFDSFIKIKTVNKSKGELTYSIDNSRKPVGVSLDIEEAHKAYAKAARTMRTTNNSFLVTTLIIFETAVSELFEKIISKYNEVYLKDEKVDVSKVIAAENVEILKGQLVRDKVSMIMRQNILEWLKILYQKQKISIEFDEKSKQFIEGYYRRNIIVHNNGIVNEEYLEKLNEQGIKTDEKVGKILYCSRQYINNFIEASIYMLINVLYECLKLFKDETNGFLDEMEDYAVNLIECENYDLSTIIFEKLSEKDLADEQHMIYIKLNYWQSKKWNGQFKDVEEDVKKFDVSAKDEYIKLGKFALLDDFDSMINIIKGLSNGDEINARLHYAIEGWPIFKKFKDSKQYKNFLRDDNNIINANKTIEDVTDYQETKELIDTFEN